MSSPKSYHKRVWYTCQVCNNPFQAWESYQPATCSKECLVEKRTLALIENYSAKVGEPVEQWMRQRYLIDFWSYRQICKALGISHVHTLMKLFDRFGIEPRRGSEAVHAQWLHRGKMSDEERKMREYERVRHYRAKWPEKAGARSAVRVAVLRGELPRLNDCACARCGAAANHYHHHKGYSQECWLDVIPVCHNCHHVLEQA